MATEAEAREVLINTSKDLLNDAIDEIITAGSSNVPLDGDEIEYITKKLYRAIQTLKTAQSLSLV